MRYIALPLLSAFSLAACVSDGPVQAQPQAAMAAQAEGRSDALANRFQKQLLDALTAAIDSKGAAGAVNVCATAAPELAEQLSKESGASVRRTALLTRNPAAQADATERRVMEGWAAAPLDEQGRPKRWSSQEQGGGYRYMRAIPTMPMCLACHGETIAPDVSAAIKARYPQDQATGFKQGQLRGAFSIRWDEAALARAIAKQPQ
ncbi:MAG: DUF3365 domain-containing protein [Betaproteobacteria bacterium]|nr:DUF3365 domain-containing protein [Betaproteobacteria bacterium]